MENYFKPKKLFNTYKKIKYILKKLNVKNINPNFL